MIVKDNVEGFIQATLVKSDKTGRHYVISSISSHLRTVVFKSSEKGEVLDPKFYKEPNPISHQEAVERWSKGLGKEDVFGTTPAKTDTASAATASH